MISFLGEEGSGDTDIFGHHRHHRVGRRGGGGWEGTFSKMITFLGCGAFFCGFQESLLNRTVLWGH